MAFDSKYKVLVFGLSSVSPAVSDDHRLVYKGLLFLFCFYIALEFY